MKKLLKTLLVLAMLCAVTITLVGCGKEENTNTAKEENTVNNENQEAATNFSRGEWQDNKYVNDFAGIKFNLPEGWEKYSDERIAEIMNIGVAALNEDQQKMAELAEQTAVYGMAANNPSTGASVMITIEKPVLKVTPEYYVSSVKQQLEAVEGVGYVVGEQYTTKIAGTEYQALDANATVSGYTVSQTYYIKAVDDYIVGIIITTTGDGQLNEILSYFE